MRRITSMLFGAAAMLVGLSAVSCAPAYSSDGTAHTYFGFSIGVNNAPPPPRVVFYGPPRRERVEYTTVEVVQAPSPDCDMFAYGGVYWLYSGGYWYRSDRYNGTYRVVEVRSVPHEVLAVPTEHWRHPPPGHHEHWDQGWHGEKEHGHGKGHGHGHGDDQG